MRHPPQHLEDSGHFANGSYLVSNYLFPCHYTACSVRKCCIFEMGNLFDDFGGRMRSL